MRKHFRQYLIPVVALTGLGLSAAAFSQVGTSPADGTRPAHEAGAKHGHGHRHGHHGMRGDRFMHKVRGLNLSEQQKTTLKGFYENRKGEFKGEFDALRTQRRAFETATPGTPAYATAAAQLADAEANQARTRVKQRAEMHTKVYSILTDAQKTQLAAELAKAPEKTPKPDKH